MASLWSPGSAVRLFLAVLLLVLTAAVVLGVAQPSFAQDADELRGQREENRREAASVAAQIDALGAEDGEIVAALAAIDAHVLLQEGKVIAAQRGIGDAEALAAAAVERGAEIGAEIAIIRDRIVERAVDAFVSFHGAANTELETDTLLELELRRSFIDQIVGNEYDLVDQLRLRVAEQKEAGRAADQLLVDAELERQTLEARLAALEASRVEAEKLRVEVQGRIAEWEAASAEIEAADRAIAAEILRLEEEAAARRAAEKEAARRAAEEAARNETEGEEAEGEEAEGEETTGSIEGDFGITHSPATGRITSPFGERVHPIFGTVRTHYGIDFAGRSGKQIVAAAAGTVLSAGWLTAYGNTVVLSHGDGFSTLYAHQSSLNVSAGDVVVGGQIIGRVGTTGRSTGPHLHFEIRLRGVAVDPAPYL